MIIDKLKTFLIISIFLINNLYGAILTSNNSNTWTNGATWDLGRVPTHNDTVVIGSGFQVDVDCNCGVYNNMRIEVYGTLWFNNGRKINLDSNGVIQVYPGGIIDGGTGGSKIIIGGAPMWDADEGAVSGPAYVTEDDTTFQDGGLPIKLINFNAQATEHSINLSWSTASETNNDYFLLEKSQNEVDFKFIGLIDAKGNTKNKMHYSYIDIMPSIGVSYYRLKQTDFNGSYTYSNTASVEFFGDLQIKTTKSGNLLISGIGEDTAVIKIYDGLGREIYNNIAYKKKNNFEIKLDKDNIGYLIIIIKTRNNTYTKKYSKK